MPMVRPLWQGRAVNLRAPEHSGVKDPTPEMFLNGSEEIQPQNLTSHPHNMNSEYQAGFSALKTTTLAF